MTQPKCKLLPAIIVIVMLSFVPDSGASEYAGRGGWGAHESVYRVKCRAEHSETKEQRDVDVGTAFGHKSGNVLSANHVVDECIGVGGTILLVPSEGTDSIAKVVSRDAGLDLVLLKPNDGFVKSHIPIATNDKMVMGSQVSSWGFPGGYTEKDPLLTVGFLAGISPDLLNRSIKRWVINAAINKGNSGGPLLETATPSVIGVVILKYSPLGDDIKKELKKISKNGSAEAKLLAQALINVGEGAQMVIAQSVRATDLRAFLRQAGVEP